MSTGGITPVPGASTNPEIVALAQFAVKEYNKKKKVALRYVKVVNARQQVVAGMKYFIVLQAIDGGEVHIYEAIVWVKTWEHDYKKLLDFNLLSTGVY